MKAIVLKKTGDPAEAFEIKEMPEPVIGPGQVIIQVKYSGLNFADVMARKGLYKEAPPIPSVLGYDVSGVVLETGAGVQHVKAGDEVFALTRFGGYAEKVVTDARGVACIPQGLDGASATALATHYCTAWYAAAELANIREGEKVLIQSGAGGVGIALIQYALYKNCEIFATAGSSQKIDFLQKMGVHHPINYSTTDFAGEITKITHGKGVDVIFDAVGGSSVKKGMQLLSAGGRLVCYGASALSNKNLLQRIKTGLSFGFYHPAMLMMPSKSLLGLNMLKIAENKPELLQHCLQQVVMLAEQRVFVPKLHQLFPVEKIAEAHAMLADRGSIGKIALEWQ